MRHNTKKNVFVFLIVSVVISATTTTLAWTGPSQSAPGGNISAPVNVGNTDQVKNAGLSLNALAVFGNAILSGASRYLNFGTTAGSGGYGIRDNAGVMEFKNSAGSWSPIGGATGATPWLVNGTHVYYNGGNVGIGTETPSYKLDVNGTLRVASTADFLLSDATSARTVRIGYQDANNYARILAYGSSHASTPNRLLIDNVVGGSNTAGGYIDFRPELSRLTIYPSNSGTTYIAGGNVGIGTQSPAAKLEVIGGNTRVSKYLEFNDYDDNNFTNPVRLIARDGRLVVWNTGLVVGNPANNELSSFPGTGDIYVKGTMLAREVQAEGNSVFQSVHLNNNLYVNGAFRMTSPDTGGGSHFACWVLYNPSVGSSNFKAARSTSGCTSSDSRLKENIEPLKAGLAEVLKLNPVTYEWKDKQLYEPGTKLGLIAQDVKEIFPEVVTGTGTGVNGDYYRLDYQALIAPMINAIKELKAENDRQDTENESLRAEIDDLRKEIEELKQRY